MYHFSHHLLTTACADISTSYWLPDCQKRGGHAGGALLARGLRQKIAPNDLICSHAAFGLEKRIEHVLGVTLRGRDLERVMDSVLTVTPRAGSQEK